MRADIYLVENGFYPSRARAQAAIKAGMVSMNGTMIAKPNSKILEGAEVVAEAEHPWVSRGGLKLDHALKVFGINVSGMTALDVGASTGGFTDVLLARGAAKVYAVDVGTGQLHPRIKDDARVVSWESTDARTLRADQFEPAPNIIVCDASFISCLKVLEIPLGIAAAGADLVTLVKPQFEVGRSGIGKGGIVKSQDAALQALDDVKDWVSLQGWAVRGSDTSPITGGSGNTEFLLHAVKG